VAPRDRLSTGALGAWPAPGHEGMVACLWVFGCGDQINLRPCDLLGV